MKQRAISPIIATVILVAVTIALAVGVALWFSGIIGGAGSHEQLLVLPDGSITVISSSSATLSLHVRNSGSVDSKIIAIKVGNYNVPISSSSVTVSPSSSLQSNYILVPAGQDIWINATLSGQFTPGSSYKVTVVTDAGNSYIQELQAVQGTS